ncbi:MAG: hypothetical protein WCI73_18075 [Phycisphaerae bacterium]
MAKKARKFRMTATDRKRLDDLIEKAICHPYWIQLSVLRAILMAMQHVRSLLATADGMAKFLQNPSEGIALPIRWHPLVGNSAASWHQAELEHVSGKGYKTQEELDSAVAAYANWFAQTKALSLLTQGARKLVSSGRYDRGIDGTLDVMALSELERLDHFDELFRRQYLAVFLTVFPASRWDAGQWRTEARAVRYWKAVISIDGQSIPISLFTSIEPMVDDMDKKTAYFPLMLALKCSDSGLQNFGSWQADKVIRLWERLERQVHERVDFLADVSSRGTPVPTNPFSRVTPEIAPPQAATASASTDLAGNATSDEGHIELTKDPMIVIVDGKEITLKTQKQTDILEVLCERRRKWTGKKIFENNKIFRHDLTIKTFPAEIRNYIKVSHSGFLLDIP